MNSIFDNSECTVYINGETLEGNYNSSLLDVLVNPLICEETIIRKIRALEYGCTEQKRLKVLLSAATFSSVQGKDKRGEKNHLKHSGFIQFDIDGKDHESMKDQDGVLKMKDFVSKLKYTAYCGLSASGMGVWGLFKIKYTDRHLEHFEAMFKSFKAMGIDLDRKPKNVASLRFIAYDQDAYINHSAAIFDLLYTEPKIEKKVLKSNNSNDNNHLDAKALRDKFNTEAEFDIINDILLNAGWQYHSEKGKNICYTRPGKSVTAGLSANYHLDTKRFTTYSSASPGLSWFKENDSGTWTSSPVDMLLNYECGGDWAKAFKYMKQFN